MGEVELSEKNRTLSLSLTASQRLAKGEEGLRFDSVCVDVSHKRILWDISGHASPGRVLAVMGPSGELRFLSEAMRVPPAIDHVVLFPRVREDDLAKHASWSAFPHQWHCDAAWTTDYQEDQAEDQLCPSS